MGQTATTTTPVQNKDRQTRVGEGDISNSPQQHFSLSADLSQTIRLTGFFLNKKSWACISFIIPSPTSSLSVLSAAPFPLLPRVLFNLSNSFSPLYLTLCAPPSSPVSYSVLSFASPPPASQSNSQFLLLQSAGRRAGSSWGKHGRHLPRDEVIFSSLSSSHPLHPRNPFSQPKDSKLTDYLH